MPCKLLAGDSAKQNSRRANGGSLLPAGTSARQVSQRSRTAETGRGRQGDLNSKLMCSREGRLSALHQEICIFLDGRRNLNLPGRPSSLEGVVFWLETPSNSGAQ